MQRRRHNKAWPDQAPPALALSCQALTRQSNVFQYTSNLESAKLNFESYLSLCPQQRYLHLHQA